MRRSIDMLGSQNLSEFSIAALRVDDWFLSAGTLCSGRIANADALLKAPFKAGWRVERHGHSLVVLLDENFPFSKVEVRLANGRGDKIQPHVEHNGKLCLSAEENYALDPVSAVKNALSQSFKLLKQNEQGYLTDDFQDDFLLYWNNYIQEARYVANLNIPAGLQSRFGSYCVIEKEIYCFAGRGEAEPYLRNIRPHNSLELKRSINIRLFSLPSPDRYPDTYSELEKLINDRTSDGLLLFQEALCQQPKSIVVVLMGFDESGRDHAVAIRLSRPVDQKGQTAHRRFVRRDFSRLKDAPSGSLGDYNLTRLTTRSVNAALTRLPYDDVRVLAEKRVAIIGCGALGSGVAKLLAKAGIGHLKIVDDEDLRWENIRRHELGAAAINQSKAAAMAADLGRNIPDIGSVEAFNCTVQKLCTDNPKILANIDLIVSCSGSWFADTFIDIGILDEGEARRPVIYGWLEDYSVAAHSVFLNGADGLTFRDGFDAYGNFHGRASTGAKRPPPGCGVSTSPFGAVELSAAQSLVARTALNVLRGRLKNSSWRTWLTDQDALKEAGASWKEEWLEKRGEPGVWGGVSEADWKFD